MDEPARDDFELLDFIVVGTQHAVSDGRALQGLENGRELELTWEHKNPHDSYAVRVDAAGYENGRETWRQKLGYVPMTHSRVIARLIREGFALTCEVDVVHGLEIAASIRCPKLKPGV